MSDIWIKQTTGTTSTAWKRAVSLFVKTTTGTTSAAWKAATSVYVYFSSGWTRVWPVSGVFSVTSPYIATSSGSTTPLYGVDGVRRVGSVVFGKNGTWNANGWVINSYQYRWRAYNSSEISDTNIGSQTSLATYSSAVSLTIPATYDKKYLSFFIQANSSGGSAYNGFAESGASYGGLQIVRQQPLNISASLSTLAPKVGDTISFSSSWNITEAYAPEASRATINWYKNLTNSTSGGTSIGTSGSYSYIVQSSDLNHYIYAIETTFNSGSDYDLGVDNGVSVSRITTSTVTEVLLPQNFTTISFTKAFPSSGSQGVSRTTALSWNASTNATKYRVQYEGKATVDGAWTTVQTFAADSDITSTSDSGTWSSPKQTGGFDYYTFMRASVRAANDSSTVKYSNSTANPSDIVWIEASGTAPAQPTFGTITYNTNKTTATVPVTAGSQGTNFRYEQMEYQYRTSSGSYSGTWSTQALSSGSGNLSLAVSSETTYYVKIRNKNYDELYSSENETSFTVPAVTKYDVTWNANGGTGGRTDNVAPGTVLTAPTVSRTNHVFVTWRNPESGGDPVFVSDGGTYTSTSSNFTWYAKWTYLNLVSFSVNGGGGTAPTAIRQTTGGGSITLPGVGSMTAPTGKPNFRGWSTSTTGTTPLTSPYTPTADITLYAIWEADAVVAPGTPASVSWNAFTYAYVANSLSTTLTNAASGNSTKTQNWTYQARVTFNFTWPSVTGATSYEYFIGTGTSPTAPTSTSTGVDVGNNTSSSFTGVQTGRNTLSRTVWVRAVNSAGKSAWRAATNTASAATVVSGLNTAGNLRICRTGTSTCSNAPTTGMNNVLSHAYTSVNTGFSHVAYISGMNIADATGLSANS